MRLAGREEIVCRKRGRGREAESQLGGREEEVASLHLGCLSCLENVTEVTGEFPEDNGGYEEREML